MSFGAHPRTRLGTLLQYLVHSLFGNTELIPSLSGLRTAGFAPAPVAGAWAPHSASQPTSPPASPSLLQHALPSSCSGSSCPRQCHACSCLLDLAKAVPSVGNALPYLRYLAKSAETIPLSGTSLVPSPRSMGEISSPWREAPGVTREVKQLCPCYLGAF